MQKKILVFLLCGVFAAGMVGCGSSSEEEEETEKETETETGTEEEAVEEEEEVEEVDEDAAEETEEADAEENSAEDAEEETEEAEPLSPEEYLDLANSYCDAAQTLASDIADAGKDSYMYYAAESTTADEVLEQAVAAYEEVSGNTFESIGETLSDLTESLSVLKHVPEDEECEAWYQDVILPLNTDLIDIYSLVYDSFATYLPGSLSNSRAYKEEYDSLTEDLDHVTEAYAELNNTEQSE